jgi:hypothetical protein
MTRRAVFLRCVALMLICAPGIRSSAVDAQIIEFETRPPGETETVDLEEISTQYSALPFGVSFQIVDADKQFVGFPRIAKVGHPETAFVGCPGADTPLPNQGVGLSFLTDDDKIGLAGNLLVTYSTPVVHASGAILDVDRHEEGTFEEWTITARNAAGATVAQDVRTAPAGEASPPVLPGQRPRRWEGSHLAGSVANRDGTNHIDPDRVHWHCNWGGSGV